MLTWRDTAFQRISGAIRLIRGDSLIFTVAKWAPLFAGPLLIIWSIQSWDRPLLDYVVRMRTDPLLDVADIASVLGSPTIYLLPAGLAFLIFKGGVHDQIKANRALFVLCAATAPALCTDLLQLLFARATPSLLLDHGVYEFLFFYNAPEFASFPSEHATVVGSLASAFSGFLPAYRSTFFLLAAIVAVSRLFLAAHYLSDVLAGFLIGIWFVLLLRAGFTRFGFPLNLSARRLSRP